MKNITKYLFCLLAVSLAFGAFNPFDLRGVGNITEHTNEQRGFTPILFGLCSIFVFFDKNILLQIPKFKKFLTPLLFLLLFYFLSSVLFDISTIGNYIFLFIKLLIAFIGFFSFSIYFYCYPQKCSLVCRIFSLTCGLICLAFLGGMLDGFYYFSNGRLWLFGENPNSHSFILGFGALLLCHDLYSDIKIKYKVIFSILILFIIIFILLSGSRGTLIFFVLAFMIINAKFFKKYIISSLLIVVCGFTFIMAFLTDYSDGIAIFERLQTLQSGDDGREILIKNAFSLFSSNPLFGYGMNGYDYMKANVFHDMRDSHNMIISILAVSGCLGFYAIMIFYSRMLSTFKKAILNNNNIPFALFVYVFLISMKTGGIITYSMMWFAYAVILSKSISFNGKRPL